MVHDALVAGGTEDGGGRFAGLRRHRRRPGAPSSALCRRCSFCASSWPSWRIAATWLVLPSSWTVFSAALACPASPSFRFWCPGCGVPGVMASRTIENEKDRRMTVMTTTFIPCGVAADHRPCQRVPSSAILLPLPHGSARSSTSWVFFAVYRLGSCSRRPSSSPAARRRSLWSFPPTTSRRSCFLGAARAAGAAGPLSRRPARSSSRPLSWFGSCPTLVATTVPLASCLRWTASPRSSWTTPSPCRQPGRLDLRPARL